MQAGANLNIDKKMIKGDTSPIPQEDSCLMDMDPSIVSLR